MKARKQIWCFVLVGMSVLLLTVVAGAAPTKTPPVTLGAQTLLGDGTPPTAYEFFRQSGSSWKGDIDAIVAGKTYSLVITGINVTGVTGPANRDVYFNLQDSESGSTFDHLGILAHLDAPGAGGGTLLQCYQNFTAEGLSSHGLNPGDLTPSDFDLRFDFTKASAGVGWNVTPYFRLHGGSWTPFIDGPFTGTVPFNFVGAKLIVAFDGGADGTLSFTNYYLSGPPSNTYVDDNWAGYAIGTPVQFPGFTDWHTFGVDAFATIQGGIDAVVGSTVNVAAGPYADNILINKKLTLQGAGSSVSGTVITPPSGIGIIISASGASSSDRLTVKDLRVTGASSNGIDIDAANVSYLTFDNVACVANGYHGINTNPPTGSGNFVDVVLTNCDLSSNAQAGFRPASYVGINGLTITGGHMDGNLYGWYSDYGYTYPILTNVNVTGTTFSNNTSKGIYLEKLDHATFTDIVVNNSGTVGAWAAGIDINEKFASYQNVIFNNPMITGCGTGDAVNGAGITVKARDDGSTYGAHPASLTNLQINYGTITGNQEGIRLGEPGKNNAGPTNVVLYHNTITGNVLKTLRNVSLAQTNAERNYWGSTDKPTIAGTISGLADFIPYCNSDFSICNYGLTVHNITHPADYDNLTTALTAAQPGDEIHVDAGAIFYEHDVPITKPVTLIGVPGDATPGTGVNPPVVDGQNLYHYGFLFGTGANHVIISGFEVRNYIGPDNGDGDAFQAWYANTDHVTITDNYMHHLGANGVLVGSDSREAAHSDWTIARNVLTDFGPPLPFNGTDQGYGLELTNTSNGVIADNIIEAGSRGPGMAIRVSGRLAYQHTITVSGNQVRGAYERCAIQVNAYDIEGVGSTLDGVTIENNDIEISVAPRVLYLRDDYSGGTAVLTNVGIHDNRLVSTDNQLCVESLTDQTMDASGNWWGSADPAMVAAKFTALKVDYTPWLGTSADTGDPGFHGDFHTLWVDDSSPQTGSLNYLQEAVNMVTGSTIYLAPGIYIGQVTVNAFPGTLDIVGTGITRADVVIRGVASMTPFNADRRAVLAIVGTTTVNVSHLTVDGDAKGNTNSRMFGVAYWNSGGALSDVRVTKVREEPLSGGQQGIGVYAYNNGGGPYTINLTDVQVDDYQKGGVTLNSNNNLAVNLLRVTVTGAGPITNNAQNGIQLGWGTSGTITDCHASGNFYSPGGWASCGILLYLAGNTTVIGGTLNGNQTGIDFGNTSGSMSGTSIDGSTTGGTWVYGALAENYHGYSLMVNHPRPQPMMEENVSSHGAGALDATQSVTLSGLTVSGYNEAMSVGLYAWVDYDLLNFTVNSCDVHNWEQGIVVEKSGSGSINAAVSSNKLFNTYNAYDNEAVYAAGRWSSNCYSDYSSNPGYGAGEYWVYDGVGYTQKDLTPNPNGCSNVDVVAPAYIGCAASGCPRDTLYYTLDLAGVVDGRVWLTLPAGFIADWSGATYPMYAGVGWDPKYVMGHATKLTGNRVEINMQFDLVSGGSTGNPALYIAALPILNDGAGHCSHEIVSGDSAYFIMTDLAVHTDVLVAATAITVDCAVPTGTLAYEPSAPTCNAFGTAAQLEGRFKADVYRGDVSCNAPLDEAWLTVNGHSYSFFGANPSGDFAQVFPGSGTISAATLWSWLNPGCNTLMLHFKDAECNEDSVSLENVGKDVTPPVLTETFDQHALCYNNEPRSSLYGGQMLDADLNVNADVGTGGCIAQTGTLWFRYDATANTWPLTPLTLPIVNYPADTAASHALWNWMMTQVPPNASGSFTFWVLAEDCAGNKDSLSFSICIDLVRPDNAFNIFDARPTGLGNWLKWDWTYSGMNADSAKIFHSPYAIGHYPLYNGAQTWDNFTDDADYEMNYYDAVDNWVLVAALDATAQTSGVYPGVHGGPGSAYWMYRDAAWDTVGTTDHEQRDIYRFVTFVRDASGNWSQVTAYNQNHNADRSTNYWLGDFTMDTDNDCPSDGSSGAVEGADLGIFTASYFKGANTGYQPRCDIGPETGYPQGENQIGKGIPMPDDSVNFWDLVPFSFNYYTTGFTTYIIQPAPTTPSIAGRLDEQPAVALCRATNQPINLRDEFTVVVSVSGNGQNEIKGLEAELVYDPEVIEFVASSSGEITAINSELFEVTRPIDGTGNRLGMAAAALGPVSTLSGNFTLATVTFRWKGERTASTEIALSGVRMFDAYANIMNGAGSVLSVNADGIVPTRYALYQNFPNPFNPSTTIQFDVKQTGHVVLRVYNTLGQNVATVVNSTMEAGRHSVIFDAANLASGVYVYTIEVNDFSARYKMVLMK
jgi:hypothetical protein